MRKNLTVTLLLQSPYNEIEFSLTGDTQTQQFFELETLSNTQAVIKTRTLLNVTDETRYRVCSLKFLHMLTWNLGFHEKHYSCSANDVC